MPFITRKVLASLVLSSFLSAPAFGDIRIPIPRRSKPTPVQKYNQEGLKELKKGNLDKAKRTFYKAYLLDPNDPFTLNNLGYVAELEGEIDRAMRYYDLASANTSDAVVSKSTAKELEGKPVSAVAGRSAQSGALQVNRMNVQAISLLQKDRSLEAQRVLEKALAIEPNNPFTLNNLGYAYEKQGELETAARYYDQAARLNSDERIIVAVNRDWRRKKISEVAERNASKVRRLMRDEQTVEARVARLNVRGVSALNRNDREAARKFFLEANRLQPTNAFTLNNMGYLAELDGDKESADYYYGRARNADEAETRIGVATRRDAEGKPLERVAGTSEAVVAQRMESDQAAKRRAQAGKPIQLRTRDGSVVQTPERPKDETPEDEENPR